MKRGALFDIITSAMPKDPQDAIRGFWYNDDSQEIICNNETACERAADFLEAVLGGPILTGSYNEFDGTEGLGYYITID